MVLAEKKLTGRNGEELAAFFLKKAGYKVLFRNYTTPQGELDIIAEKKDALVFVEVKTRTGDRYGSPAEAVTWSKRRHIISSALAFLQKESFTGKTYRFDIIEVYLEKTGGLKSINHIESAFDCN